MQVEFIPDAKVLGERFSKLAKGAISIEIAVAWAGRPDTGVALTLWKFRSKVARFVVGCTLFNTHPKFLKKWQGHANFRVIRSTTELFHPKLYLFRLRGRTTLLVGSSNFTEGGFEKNREANVLLSDRSPSGALSAGMATVEAYCRSGTAPLEVPGWTKWLASYRSKWALRHKHSGKGGSSGPRGSKGEVVRGLQTWSFDEYFSRIKRGNRAVADPLKVWLRFLEDIRMKWASGRWRLAGQIRPVLRCFAGIPEEAKSFGGIGQGYFLHAIFSAPRRLDAALQTIPRVGAVEDRHWVAFRQKYSKAFPHASIGSASRLLCLWRPVVFFSANKGSVSGLSESFQLSQASLKTWAGYWELVKLIQQPPWARSPRPDGQLAGRCWDGRVALLDVLMYEG